MIWYTSDLHFGHTNIINYCNRPYDNVIDMNNDLVVRWNQVVKPEDEIIILGDLCMGNVQENLSYVHKLNGRKILLVGNHDKPFRATGDKRVRCENMYLNAGISEIWYGAVVSIVGKYSVTLCHFPRIGDTSYEDRYVDYRPKYSGILLHGHTHGKWRAKDKMIDVGVDSWSGTPVSENVLAQIITDNNWFLDRLPWTPYDSGSFLGACI